MEKGPLEELWSKEHPQKEDAALFVDIDGFEGPLDLLLHLARSQKLDLSRISVEELADQYLEFVEQAQTSQLELAADYLVMAAWLAFLKSKLLLPKQKEEEGLSGAEMAAALQFRLKRLEAMRNAAASLVTGNRLGRDRFVRGQPEAVFIDKKSQFSASLYDLLIAYSTMRQRQAVDRVEIAKRNVWSLKDARSALTLLIGEIKDWTSLDHFLIKYMVPADQRVTAIASSFAASLEMVREGQLELQQGEAFEPIYMRGRKSQRDSH